MKKLIVMVAAASMAVELLSETPIWVFKPNATPADGGAGKIVSSDDVWELNVRIVKSSARTLSLGANTDAEKVAGGHAFVRGEGDLDLRGAITRENTSETWTLVNLAYGALGRGPASGFVAQGSLYAPTTLTSMNWCFVCNDGCFQSFTNVVVESPSFTTLSGRAFVEGVNTNLDRLVFKTPAMTTIPDNGFSVSWANPDNAEQPKLWGSSYDEWNLTGVESVGKNAFFGRHIHGTLVLPKVKTIGLQAFHQCTNVVKVVLSPDKKRLTCIDEKAFFQNQWGSNRYVTDSTLREVVMGGAFGFTIKTNAFRNQMALSSVSFTGAKPRFDIESDGIAFGGTNPAKSIAFYVPHNAEWADVIAMATPATFEEKTAWSAAHPDYLPIWGVIPASVFHTANDQYIGFYSRRVTRPKFFFDERLGDDAIFESLGPYPAASDGSWPTNNLFRISATVGAGGTFSRWYGDMPKDLCEQQTIEVSGDRLVDVRWLLPRITHPWTVNTTTKTISNGIWELHVDFPGGNLLRLGNTTSGSWDEDGRALTGVGSGYLDLGGSITDASDRRYTIVDVQGGHYSLGSSATKAGPTVFISPGTISGDLYKYKHLSSSRVEDSNLEVVVIDEPHVTGGFSVGWMFGGTKVQYLQIIVPKLPSIANRAFDRYGGTRCEFNLSTCDFSSVTNIGEYAFYFCSGARGAIDLPSIKCLGGRAFYACEDLQAVYLATNRHEEITSIGDNAFQDCISLEKIVLNQADGTTCPGSGFAGCSAIKEVRFLGPPPTHESLVNMLSALKETAGVKPCCVYGSRYQVSDGRSWSSLASTPTIDEYDAFAGEVDDLCGVFRKNPISTPTLGCAWIIYMASPWDPNGLRLIFR